MTDKPIMLIEDSPDDRDLTLRELKENNILNPVTVASNGVEALTMLFGTTTSTGTTRRSSCST